MSNEHGTHYICTGECGGVSDTPGVCQADKEECTKSGQELTACTCGDASRHRHTHDEA